MTYRLSTAIVYIWCIRKFFEVKYQMNFVMSLRNRKYIKCSLQWIYVSVCVLQIEHKNDYGFSLISLHCNIKDNNFSVYSEILLLKINYCDNFSGNWWVHWKCKRPIRNGSVHWSCWMSIGDAHVCMEIRRFFDIIHRVCFAIWQCLLSIFLINAAFKMTTK